MARNHDFRPEIMMVATQILYSIMNILFKLVAVTCMNLNVFVAYRLLFAAAFMTPLSLILERNRPKLTRPVLSQAFVCGSIGAAVPQNLYIASLSLTSPTFLAAMSNLLPAITFALAVCLRQEKLTTSISSLAKVAGTVIGIGGAMVFCFYRGREFNIWSTHVNLLGQHHNETLSSSHHKNPALGFFAGFGSSLCSAIWLTLQAKMSRIYPYPYSSTALMCVTGSIQAVIFAICVERDWSEWKLGLDIRVFTAAYSGIVISGGTMAMMSWCSQKRGPLFVAVFNPVTLLVVSLASSFFLEEPFTTGRVVGGVLTVIGLYIVLWGKSNEESAATELPECLHVSRN